MQPGVKSYHLSDIMTLAEIFGWRAGSISPSHKYSSIRCIDHLLGIGVCEKEWGTEWPFEPAAK